VTNVFSYLLTGTLWGLVRLGFGNTKYYDMLRRTSFYHLRHIVMDHMIPRIALYYSRAEAEELLAGRGLVNIKTSWVNNLSWSVSGQKPLTDNPPLD
jgi:hypothetical protein